jgi:hypothetical protein
MALEEIVIELTVALRGSLKAEQSYSCLIRFG